MTNVRIFISSPGDVNEERALTMRVIKRLQEEFEGRLTLDPVYWEHEPLLVTGTFQEQIPPPSESDICVCILWSRLGTRLPSQKFHHADGSPYASGTEYEFENAIEGRRANGKPDMLVYLKTAEAVVSLRDETALMERMRQKKMLDSFLRRWFQDEHEGTLIAARHDFTTLADFEERFEAHLRKLLERKAPPVSAAAAAHLRPRWEKGAPFRGLEVFEAEHAPIFCGRTRAIGDVLNALRKQAADARAFVLVTGMSGCGKSSLLRAGVLPLMMEPGVIEGVAFWRQAAMRPGETGSADLCDVLAGALGAALPELAAAGTARAELAKLLRDAPAGCGPLVKAALAIAALDLQRAKNLANIPQARLALMIDQLEEIFTTPDIAANERSAFAAALAALARSGQVWILATLRSDFYPRLAELEPLQALREGAGTYDLTPPSAAEISQIIRKPAWMAGLQFEEDKETGLALDDALSEAATRSPEALPLLEFALTELYNRCAPAGRMLTFEAYRALGGVEGALATRAEKVFQALPDEAKAALPALLGALVGIGLDEGAASVVRKRARLDVVTATPPARALVDAFVHARLLIVDRAGNEQGVLMVAHEALLRHWPRIQDWVKENLATLRTRARIASAESVWRAEGRTPDFLLPAGPTLTEAGALLTQRRSELGDAEVEFIAASLAAWRRRRMRRRVSWIAAAVAAVAALAAGWWWLDAYRLHHVSYFKQMVLRWGVYEGVTPISKSEMRARNAAIQIERRGRRGPVLRVATVDGLGRPRVSFSTPPVTYLADQPLTALEVRECAFTYDYKDGRVQSQQAFDAAGALLWEFFYVSPDTGYYRQGSALAQTRAGSGAAWVQLTRTPEGFDRDVRFTDGRKPRPNQDGSFGYAIEYDRAGFVTKVTAVDAAGAPILLRRLGFATIETTYDGAHHAIESRFFDTEGRPAAGTAGFVVKRVSWSAADNPTSETFFDEHDRPVFAAAYGYARAVIGHDERQRVTDMAFYGADGKLVLFKDTGFARRTARYDARGNMVEEACFDAANQPVAPPKIGYARAVAQYDGGDRITAREFFGADGAPVIVANFGGARLTYRYDAAGRLLEEAHFDAAGKLFAADLEGFARATFEYDARGRKQRAVLTVPTAAGAVSDAEHDLVAQAFDDAGRTTEERRTDRDGKLIVGPRGYHLARMAHQPDGRREEITFFGIDDKPVADVDGVHRIEWLHDEEGVIHGPNRFNLAGEPIAAQPGDDIDMRVQKDDRGNVIETSFVNSRGEPVAQPDYGVARTTLRYDDHGNPIDIVNYGVRGEWVVPTGAEGARVTAKYNARGEKLESVSYVPTPDGRLGEQEHRRIQRKFDAAGRVIEETHFDARGQPAVTSDGWHRGTMRYHVSGQLEELAFFDGAGQPFAIARGYARMQSVFDEAGSAITTRYFDAHGAPVATRIFVAEVTENSPGAAAGLQNHDVVVSYAGQEVRCMAEMLQLTARADLGETRELRVRRGGGVVALQVPPGRLGFYGQDFAESALAAGQ